MSVEIVMFSVWTRKKGVKLFSTHKEAIDHRAEALIGPSHVLGDPVSKIGKHKIKIEDAIVVTQEGNSV